MKTYYFNLCERVLIAKHYRELKLDSESYDAFKKLDSIERQSILNYRCAIMQGRLTSTTAMSDAELACYCDIDKIHKYFAGCAHAKRVCDLDIPYDVFKQMLECLNNADTLTDSQRKYVQLGMTASDSVTIECDHAIIRITTN